jgi:hypothetical protein
MQLDLDEVAVSLLAAGAAMSSERDRRYCMTQFYTYAFTQL